jgi:hypothetical protein
MRLQIACIGTGPSLTQQQIDTARRKGFTLYVCNDAFRLAPDAALLHACNWQWWDARWNEVKDLPCAKWTTRKESAEKYGINYIAEVNRPGLSQDPNVLHHGHSSGFQLMGMAHRNGAKRIVLLGYDMKFPANYDGRTRQVGDGKRHFFGEYEPALQHWPSVQVKAGVHVELVDFYRSVATQGLVDIVNCTPESALDCFPTKDIDAL